MQSGLDPKDRKLLLGAGACALLMAAATAAFGPSGQGGESKVPSSWSSGSAGALAAYLLLQDLHYPVRRWEEPPADLLDVAQRAVLILAEPTQVPTLHERTSLWKFVRRGGRVLFCGDSIKSFFPTAEISDFSPGQEWIEVSSDLPSAFTRGAPKITMEPQSFWTKLGVHQLALYGGEQLPRAVVWRIGDGELVWWAAATPLTNAGITKTDNLMLFMNAVSAHSPGPPLNVYWDEYFHGSRASLWSYAKTTPVKWVIVQLTIITAAVLFAFSRRWGPISMLRPISRLSPLEFVDTLGGLYQRAGATFVPTSVEYRRIRLLLARRLSLPSSISDAALARAAHERIGWDSAPLGATLDKAARAQVRSLRPSEALDLVQQIERYIARLSGRRAQLENN